MTTSMQLAQECLKEQAEEPSDTPQPLEGLEMFAQTIETGEFPKRVRVNTRCRRYAHIWAVAGLCAPGLGVALGPLHVCPLTCLIELMRG